MLLKKTQYALYALLNLARNYKKGPVLISIIAEEEKLPKKFLEAILADLKTQGLVNSKKGKGGGYYLIVPPEKIDIASIIRSFDGALGLLPCATINYYESCSQCKDENKCALRSVLRELRDQTDHFLKNISLLDLIEKEKSLEMIESRRS